MPYVFPFTIRVVFFLLVVPGFSAARLRAYDNGVVPVNTPQSARLMIEDLIATFGDKYPEGSKYLERLKEIETKLKKNRRDAEANKALPALIREASLANPLLDFDRLLLVRRKPLGQGNTSHDWGFIGLNAYTNDTAKRTGWDNELVILSDLRTKPKLRPIYRHPGEALIRDLNIDFEGDRILFSSINEAGNWAVFEIDTEGKNLRELTPNDQKDVDWFDACYLPEDGFIITASTAGMQGLPCENGSRKMVNLYRVDTNTKQVRQLTFEQDSDWHPSIMHDGRVMYLRWEYSDIPHYFSRILFAMQPDGRQQRAIWGSGSYFPTAFKNPRVVPNHASMVIGTVSGHHTNKNAFSETGRLMLLNPQLASKYPFRYDPASKEWGPEHTQHEIRPRVFPKEQTGCFQEIPGYGRDVVGNVYDNQGGNGRYKFSYPWPLSENYFLVSMRRDDTGMFGLWLVDRFDNMTCLMQLPDSALFQPIPLTATPKPPVRTDMTEPGNMQGQMFITDVYAGHGLRGVPRGTAKKLRIFAYHFGYLNSGGHESVGMVSSWDIKRILGTVPIEEDGSASFNVPANTPISIQVLDGEGRALQLMRSWTVSMPGEQQSCIGCHETPLDVTPTKRTIASMIPPRDIEPWFGPARPFGYEAEIQPLLDRKCVTCHNDATAQARGMRSFEAHNPGNWRTDTSYAALNPYTWRPGPESDLDILPPLDYHASVSELVQMLRQGHYGLELDREDWERLYTWIDLNVPYRGQWSNPNYEKRRIELSKLYADIDVNPEEEYRTLLASKETAPAPEKRTPEQLDAVIRQFAASDDLKLENWPLDTRAAFKLQGRPNEPAQMKLVLRLGEGQEMAFVKIPAGRFIAGQLDGWPDERRRKIVTIENPFWIAETEVTNGQYGRFDPNHDTRYLREDGKDHTTPGYIANHPNQPVARVTFEEAERFCRWLSEKSGSTAMLPSETQWEWAARAGTETPFWYGDRDADFSHYANLAGGEVRRTYTTWEAGSMIHERRWYPQNSIFPLRDDRFSDKWFVVDYVKQYEPNPWGLYDMIGNVWEWTRSDTGTAPEGMVAARGGSWKDRPKVVGAAARVYYHPWQKVMNVGFRPVLSDCQ